MKDTITVKLGDVSVKVTRMTVKEIRESRALFAEGRECIDEAYTDLIAKHCVDAATGKPIDVSELSLPQLATLAKELAGVPDGSPLSDFIGLLC